MRLVKLLLTVLGVALAAIAGLALAVLAAVGATAFFGARRWAARRRTSPAAMPRKERRVEGDTSEVIEVTATEVPVEAPRS